jgi:CheY-like chemotaxis protein
LLVEDESQVRSLAHAMLESKGYTVLDAQNGEEALAVCERHTDPIHLIVTDVIMPGMNGRSLFDRLVSRTQAPKVLYMSGYTDEAIVHHGVLNPNTPFLPKPFTSDTLARKVREVLDSSVQEKA